eukprot:CAMPEP_0196729178 /NCGR_PEP_ID=MMETSP1091-20130531/9647_1 /TAXON_ID=302021 /ORGANISM="Rhodomonas sp., Strain CCMP768" /LENGTH=157 /DNA_ID=CAMNT_0042072037 /DNA_START=25 /DNA_END=494 /DNA_ORIENTATION=-
MNPDGAKDPAVLNMGHLSLSMDTDPLAEGSGHQLNSQLPNPPSVVAPEAVADSAGMMPPAEGGEGVRRKTQSLMGDDAFEQLSAMNRCAPRSSSSPTRQAAAGRLPTMPDAEKVGQEVGPELSLDTVQVDAAPAGDMKMKMDLLGKGSDGARSHKLG